MVEIFEAMKVVEIPDDRCLLAVDLKCIKSLVAARIPGGFEGCQRAVAKTRQERAGVIDAYRLFLAGEIVFAGLDEGFRHRRNFFNRSVQPKRGIDIMREKVAGDAAPR